MKKIITLVKIMLPLFIMFICTNVNAVTITVDTTKTGTTDPNSYLVTNKGTITINNSDTFDELYAYKIINTYYNSNTNEITYEYTETFLKFAEEKFQNIPTIEEYFQLTSGDITSGSTQTTSTLDFVMSIYASYIRENKIPANEKFYSSPEKIIAEAGSYLILPKYTESIYAVMVGNIEFTSIDSEWILNDMQIVAKRSPIGVKRYIGEKEYEEKTFIVGRPYTNYIIATVPIYPTNATNKKYTIIDSLAEGITFSSLNTIKLIISGNEYKCDSTGIIYNDEGNILATSTFLEQQLTIELNLDNIFSTEVEVQFQTELNDLAKPKSANYSGTEIIYASDPYGTAMSDESHIGWWTSTISYTYDLAILKYDIDDNSKLLNGAVFEIYTDEDLTDLVGIVTTGTEEDGLGLFHGLAQGTYYIKEKTAPTGYKLIKDIIIYELDAGQNEGFIELQSLEDELPEGTFLLEIPNEKISFLPVTGGIGTIIYTLVGLLTVGISFLYIIAYNKKRN